MHYRINIQPDAKNDIIKASDWYDSKHFGLGPELIQKVDEAIKQVLLQLLGYQKVFLNFRKVLIKQFSYCIYYHIDSKSEKIDIVAVIHTSRSPEVWKKRIRK